MTADNGRAMAKNRAMPPPRGFTAAGAFRPPGLSTKSNIGAIRRTHQVAAQAIAKLTTGRSRIDRVIGRRTANVEWNPVNGQRFQRTTGYGGPEPANGRPPFLN